MASYQIPFIVEFDKAVAPYQIRTLLFSGKSQAKIAQLVQNHFRLRIGQE